MANYSVEILEPELTDIVQLGMGAEFPMRARVEGRTNIKDVKAVAYTGATPPDELDSLNRDPDSGTADDLGEYIGTPIVHNAGSGTIAFRIKVVATYLGATPKLPDVTASATGGPYQGQLP